ncbi:MULTISPECIES: hypothetical protein [Agrobacterium]|nr:MULTISPECIES: hypothetical protein [Agrobacterium]
METAADIGKRARCAGFRLYLAVRQQRKKSIAVDLGSLGFSFS